MRFWLLSNRPKQKISSVHNLNLLWTLDNRVKKETKKALKNSVFQCFFGWSEWQAYELSFAPFILAVSHSLRERKTGKGLTIIKNSYSILEHLTPKSDIFVNKLLTLFILCDIIKNEYKNIKIGVFSGTFTK